MYTRKEFILKFANGIKFIGVAVFLFPFLFKNKSLLASSKNVPDLLALKGGSGPADLFLKGIGHLGGMKSFVKKGQSVLVKPNIGWDRGPEYGANTNPDLVGAIVRECFKAGASKVFVMDHTCDPWKSCYEKSGIKSTVKAAGGQMVSGASKSYYRKVNIPRGLILKETLVHKLYIESDVVINVPVLKHHSSTGMTSAMKNLMGVVWDRYEWHSRNLHQCISDFAGYRKPDLSIIDAYGVMTKNGPRGYSKSDIVNYKYLFMSRDQVAADSAGAMVLASTVGSIKRPTDVDYIDIASKAGLGNSSLKKMKIKRLTF